MRHIFCTAFILLLCISYTQAAEVPFIELKGHTDNVMSATFLPGGTKIGTASYDGTARIWDVESGRELTKLTGFSRRHATFSKDGKKIYTLDDVPNVWDRRNSGIARVWDAESGKELFTYSGGYYRATSPDGKKFFTWDVTQDEQDSTTHGWDAETGKELYILPGLLVVPISPDNKKIVTRSDDNSVHIWDTELGKELYVLPGWVNYNAFSPDGTKIVTEVDKTLRIWEAESGKGVHVLPGRFILTAPVFSPDGKKIVTRDANSVRLATGDTGIYPSILQIWDVESGKELQKLEGHPGTVDQVSFSPNGKKIVVGSYDKANNTSNYQIWDVKSGERLLSIEKFFRFSPNGKRIFMSAGDPIRILDAESGKQLHELPGFFLTLSEDGKKLVTRNDERKIVRIYDVSAIENP